LLENNPYDGHTLAVTLEAAEAVTGVGITDAYVDKGYRGHGCGRTVPFNRGERGRIVPEPRARVGRAGEG